MSSKLYAYDVEILITSVCECVHIMLVGFLLSFYAIEKYARESRCYARILL